MRGRKLLRVCLNLFLALDPSYTLTTEYGFHELINKGVGVECFAYFKFCVYFLSSKRTFAYSTCGPQPHIGKYGPSLPFNNLSCCCLFLNLMDEINDPEFVIYGTSFPLQPQFMNQ